MPHQDKASSKENPVAQPSQDWVNNSPIWNLVDTLWEGTEGMRKAAQVFLPQEPAETETAYWNRLHRSVLTPLYPDTIKKLVGKIMKRPVVLEDDVPASVMRYMDDVDAAGTDINEWTKRVATAALNHGVTYILVDSPNDQQVVLERGEGEAITRLDDLTGVMRPYAIHVKRPQVLGFKTQMVGGQIKLKQVRILMVNQEDSPEDEFTQVEVSRIHVWEIGMVRVYKKEVDEDGKVEWILERTTVTELDFIPLFPVYSNMTEFMRADPPMLDIAHLNVAHWQSDSDQRHILHVARVPILFGSGLGDNERGDFQVQVGPNTMTRGPQGSELKYVEHTGAGIEAGAKDLETIEQRVAKLGLNMITRRQPGDITATARVLDQSESDSPLGMFARHLESCLEQMLDLFVFFLDGSEDGGGSVTVFKDFSLSQRDSEDVKALADMRARSDISQLTYWDELKRRGLLNDDFDPEREIDLLDLEYQDSQAGITEAELEAGNAVGDETEQADGHTHVLQANGLTNIVDGHRHSWEPTGSETSTDNGHSHRLRGIEDGTEISRQGQSQEAGAGPQGNPQSGLES